jgi:PAS domain S-box-containing protein
VFLLTFRVARFFGSQVVVCLLGAIARLHSGIQDEDDASGTGSMSDISSSVLPRTLNGTNVEDVVSAARRAIDFREDGQIFELPALLFEQLPFGIYVCDRDGLLVRYNRRAAELWGRSPNIGDCSERFCGSYRMFRPDGSPLPHDECPMADVLRTGVSVRRQEVHIERPDGLRGIALVDIEAVTDSEGNIIGAVNCFQDISERKQTEAREKMLTRELDHQSEELAGDRTGCCALQSRRYRQRV